MSVRSVYVHAPFCARRCGYCDFAVHVAKRGDARAWLDAIAGEWRAVRDEGVFRVAPELSTLYVGGGTPSHLGAEAMAGLRDVIGAERLGGPHLEWTAEANPESFRPALASAWRAAGVNRVSIGVQSFDPGVLRWMGRMHGAEGAERAVAIATAAGFDNLSVDLIFGLPPSLDRRWSEDLRRALELDVAHVSLYGLTVEADTPLARQVAEGRVTPIEQDVYEAEYLEAVETLADAGYEHYEVSNFARPGRRSRHNSVYWSGQPYLGLGNGAHSYCAPLRRWNERSWETYRSRATTGAPTVAGSERLTPEQGRLERIWLSLRTEAGVEAELLGGAVRPLLDAWIRDALATESEGRLRLTATGWLVMDRLTVQLDEALTASSTPSDLQV